MIISAPEADAQCEIGSEAIEYASTLPSGQKNKVWDTARDIARHLGIDHDPAGYFLSNIAPLPRQNVGIAHSGIDEETFRSRVLDERVGRLVDHHGSHPDNAMIFHGKAAWRGYKVLHAFGLREQDGWDADSQLVIFDKERLIFTPTFSWGGRHFSQRQREAVTRRLSKWAP